MGLEREESKTRCSTSWFSHPDEPYFSQRIADGISAPLHQLTAKHVLYFRDIMETRSWSLILLCLLVTQSLNLLWGNVKLLLRSLMTTLPVVGESSFMPVLPPHCLQKRSSLGRQIKTAVEEKLYCFWSFIKLSSKCKGYIIRRLIL